MVQQVVGFQDVLSPTDTDWDAVLNRICSGFAQGAWSASGGTIADPWDNRFRINVAGSDLALSAAGQIQSGTISAFTVTDAGEATLATLTSPAWGGLSLYASSLRGAYRSAEERVAHWAIPYAAAAMPDSGYNGGMGVTLEGAHGQDTINGSRWIDALRGGNDRIDGGDGNDLLQGDHTAFLGSDAPAGDDTLYGGGGDDQLLGDAGSDRLFGGSGADLFYLTDAAGDRGRDFVAADDQIALQTGTAGLTGTGALLASRFKDLASGTVDADDRVIYRRDTGRLWIDSDGRP